MTQRERREPEYNTPRLTLKKVDTQAKKKLASLLAFCQPLHAVVAALINSNMHIPFCYHLYHTPTGLRYYGVRFAKKCSPADLWTTYFSTSKLVKQLIEDYGSDSFIVTVRRTFATAEAALNWEHKVLRRLNAAESRHWLNRHNGGNKFRGPLTHTPETIAKFSSKLKGRKMSDEWKQRMSESGKRNWDKRRALGKDRMPEEAVKQGVVTRQARIATGEINPYSKERNSKMAKSKRGTKRHYLPDGSYVMRKPHIV
jgi:hypothetical protein